MGSAFAVPCLDNKNDVTIVGTHLEDDLIKTIKSNNELDPNLFAPCTETHAPSPSAIKPSTVDPSPDDITSV